jgi:hypothetical protein
VLIVAVQSGRPVVSLSYLCVLAQSRACHPHDTPMAHTSGIDMPPCVLHPSHCVCTVVTVVDDLKPADSGLFA